TDEDSVFCDGINSALELLNGLDASVRAAAALIVALVNSAPTDTAKLADEIEALHSREKDARRNLLSLTSETDGDVALAVRRKVEATALLNNVLSRELPTIIAALRELDAVKAREAKLREALEPFAAVAERDIGDDEADHDRYRVMSERNARAPLLCVGHFRRARAALGGAG
ncbi:MAG: hypothetical protein LLG08_00085, partial [Actinomycetia bacterium]|nr:hypothetical protein [Actinomycetes bacterium]